MVLPAFSGRDARRKAATKAAPDEMPTGMPSTRATLRAGLARLDLVTREEFEVQRAVLQRTREKLDAIERQLAALEARGGVPDRSAN